ncbi:hypothetical protein HK098_002067 [Nowakowskiella sp. JEL0407]|nr:hypothetical protein HK098_002067 [Nowakowskiella sp. JEL0407]
MSCADPFPVFCPFANSPYKCFFAGTTCCPQNKNGGVCNPGSVCTFSGCSDSKSAAPQAPSPFFPFPYIPPSSPSPSPYKQSPVVNQKPSSEQSPIMEDTSSQTTTTARTTISSHTTTVVSTFTSTITVQFSSSVLPEPTSTQTSFPNSESQRIETNLTPIVIGTIFGVLAIVAAIFIVVCKRQKETKKTSASTSNLLVSTLDRSPLQYSAQLPPPPVSYQSYVVPTTIGYQQPPLSQIQSFNDVNKLSMTVSSNQTIVNSTTDAFYGESVVPSAR